MRDTQPIVEVLLATYNGAAFVREQIESVLAQSGIEIRMLARDDGSRDGTAEILHEYAAKEPVRFCLVEDGISTGSAKGNFARLLAASTTSLVAFCDQDDVWLPHKLRDSVHAMQQLEAQHSAATPLLVYTDLRVVDDSLHAIADSLWTQNGLTSATAPVFAKLLRENVVTGCTALLNRALVERMLPIPDAAQMHDHWAALIAAGTGAMAAVPQPSVLYRQHSHNVVGAVQGGQSPHKQLQRLVGREGMDKRAKQYALDRAQAAALLQQHSARMTPATRKTAEAFVALEDLSRIAKAATVLRYGLWRDGMQRKIAMICDLLR